MEVLFRSVDHNKGAKMKRHILCILLLFSAYLLSGISWIRSYSSAGLCPNPYDSGQGHAYNVFPAIGGGYLLQGFAEYIANDSLLFETNIFWKIDDNGDLI